MPKTFLDKYSAPKRDPLKGLVLEYMNSQRITQVQLAKDTGMNERTLCRRFAEHSDNWSIKEIKNITRSCRIPSMEVKAAIRI